MTGSEVMDFSVEDGYSHLRILAGNEEQVCQFQTVSTEGFTPVPCAKTVPESDLVMPLGLALSEKQTPQITENTEKPK